MFVRVDIDAVGMSTFQWMPHSTGLVTYGGEPTPVPDNLIYAIQRRVKEIANAGGELFAGLRSGDIVRILYSPFEGYEAIFNGRRPRSERVRMLLQLLSDWRVPLELDAAHIQQKKRS